MGKSAFNYASMLRPTQCIYHVRKERVFLSAKRYTDGVRLPSVRIRTTEIDRIAAVIGDRCEFHGVGVKTDKNVRYRRKIRCSTIRVVES